MAGCQFAYFNAVETLSIAVALLHAYANPAHERAIGAALRARCRHVSLSHEVSPEAREYERTLTTVLNVTCLKRGQDTIVFDCGSGANFLPGTGKLAASLEAAGIAPDLLHRVTAIATGALPSSVAMISMVMRTHLPHWAPTSSDCLS